MSHTKPTTSRRRFLRIAAGSALALLAGGGRLRSHSAPAPQLEPLVWNGIAFGAEVSIELHHHDRAEARAALRSCVSEIHRLESIFSLYDARSSVGRLNREGSLSCAPSELLEVIAMGRRFSELTEGAFDLTIHPLCELLAARGAAVTEQEVSRVLERIDYRAVQVSGDEVRFLRPDMRLTCNGIAQGYITDCIADRLRAAGFEQTLIDLGEKRALGMHPSGRTWRVGVESPLERTQIIGVVDLADRALATSGGYGMVYQPGLRHHLLDARSGSSRHEFASISVLAPRAATADALSTTLAVLEPARIKPLLAHFAGVEVYVVGASDGSFHAYPA